MKKKRLTTFFRIQKRVFAFLNLVGILEGAGSFPVGLSRHDWSKNRQETGRKDCKKLGFLFQLAREKTGKKGKKKSKRLGHNSLHLRIEDSRSTDSRNY